MSLKNLLKVMICLVALLAIKTMLSVPTSAGKATMTTSSSTFMEQAQVMVNCSEATLTTIISLMSSDATFVHYPSGIDMMDSNFALCEAVSISFSPIGSVLWYLFDTTNTALATGYANAITPSIGGAFGLSFSYFSAGVTEGKTNVTYTSSAIANVLSYYTTTAKPLCLKSDLAGFSNAIPNVLNVLPSQSCVLITGYKTSGSYDWRYVFFAGYLKMQIPTGSGYTVNVLNLLGATSLEPSSYALVSISYYNSLAVVYVETKTTVSFASCTPNQVLMPYTERGWYISLFGGLNVYGMFSFGNDTTPVTVLTFTFIGLIVPEFPSLTLIIAIMVCTVGIISFKKRFPKKFQ